MKQLVGSLLATLILVSCSSVEVPSEEEDLIATAARRIDLPRAADTLRFDALFKLKGEVTCHNPIIGMRVEITDRSLGQGDGVVLGTIDIPASGTTEINVDTLLALPQLSGRTEDARYGFILVEVYEGREYRAGFEPVVIIE